MFLKLIFFAIIFKNSAGSLELFAKESLYKDNSEIDSSIENIFDKNSMIKSKSYVTSNQCSTKSTGAVSSTINGMFQNVIHRECQFSSPSLWPEDYGPSVFNNPSALNNFDFVIVGAGSAGSVLANRLSERSDWKILLIEAGGDPPIESQIPAYFPLLMNTSYSYNYIANKTSKASNVYKFGPVFPSGKMLGGSSSINAMLYLRGVPEDYDGWNVPGWSFNDVLPYFKKSENNKDFKGSDFHGYNGPLSVENYGLTPELSLFGIIGAASELGYKILNDYNQEQHTGFLVSQGTLLNSERCSTARAFLSPIKNRPNLKVIKNARATHLIMNNLKVDGIKFLLRGRSMKVRAHKEVILSAGAFESPKILMLSGIGRNDDLKLG